MWSDGTPKKVGCRHTAANAALSDEYAITLLIVLIGIGFKSSLFGTRILDTIRTEHFIKKIPSSVSNIMYSLK